MFGSLRPWKAWSWRISSNTITPGSKVFTSLEKVSSQSFPVPTLLASPNTVLNRTSHPTRGISSWESQRRLTALGKTGTSCQRQAASRHPGWDYSDPKYQQTVDPSVCFVESLEVLCTDFLGDLCYIPEMQILPLTLNKCIHAVVFMVQLTRAVSLPGLPCLVPLGVGWGLCDSPHFHVSVRSGYRYCFVIIAV